MTISDPAAGACLREIAALLASAYLRFAKVPQVRLERVLHHVVKEPLANAGPPSVHGVC